MGASPGTGNAPSTGIERPWSPFLYSNTHARVRFAPTMIYQPIRDWHLYNLSPKKIYELVVTGKANTGERGSEHALCNSKPVWQPGRDSEAPAAGDGVQSTFLIQLSAAQTGLDPQRGWRAIGGHSNVLLLHTVKVLDSSEGLAMPQILHLGKVICAHVRPPPSPSGVVVVVQSP